MVGYLPLTVLFVLFPALVAGGALLAPILFAFLFATGTGFAFGMQPISTEYSSLRMTLTTLGTLLLATRAGAPVGSLEAVAPGLSGGVLSICGVAVAAVIGMRVSSRESVAAPVPLTSATMYAEVGSAGFLRMGSLLGLLGLVCLPAVCGYLPIETVLVVTFGLAFAELISILRKTPTVDSR